jgi:hypothetical protein
LDRLPTTVEANLTGILTSSPHSARSFPDKGRGRKTWREKRGDAGSEDEKCT